MNHFNLPVYIYILFIDIIEHITHTHTDIYIYIYIHIHTYIFVSCNTIQTIYHNIYIYTYYTTGHQHSHENHDDHDNNIHEIHKNDHGDDYDEYGEEGTSLRSLIEYGQNHCKYEYDTPHIICITGIYI